MSIEYFINQKGMAILATVGMCTQPLHRGLFRPHKGLRVCIYSNLESMTDYRVPPGPKAPSPPPPHPTRRGCHVNLNYASYSKHPPQMYTIYMYIVYCTCMQVCPAHQSLISCIANGVLLSREIVGGWERREREGGREEGRRERGGGGGVELGKARQRERVTTQHAQNLSHKEGDWEENCN